jgi:hypothetical protein
MLVLAGRKDAGIWHTSECCGRWLPSQTGSDFLPNPSAAFAPDHMGAVYGLDAVAIANKTARTAWALLAKEETYRAAPAA